MRQMQVEGVIIKEYSDRSTEIQADIKDFLDTIARAHCFNWTAPTCDIVRRLMNEVAEFRTKGGD